MIKKLDKNIERTRRHLRLRRKISGTAEAPRLNVYRSDLNIYAQIIDDANKNTIVSANTLQKENADLIKDKNKSDMAYEIGKVLAEKALKKGVKKVVFDRGGYIYTGRVKRLAEGARDGGLEF